jgi:hypothetical protein
MLCPFCGVGYDGKIEDTFNVQKPDPEGRWRIVTRRCTECSRINITLHCAAPRPGSSFPIDNINILAYPRSTGRAQCPPEIPKDFADDYTEACLVLSDSPKAAAALSRRCLQNLLREEAKVKHDDLSKEIDEILSRHTLPSHLSESLDAIRAVGNFAAHPIKSKSTGEIVPVETGEAEWLLDTLEGLLDYYFVQPAKTAKKKANLNQKLTDAGKSPIKS